MNYAYATLLLTESGEEINERNLTAVLEAAGTAVEASRVKAIVAALEDVDTEEVASVQVDGGPTDRAGDSPEEAPDDGSDPVPGGEVADAPTAEEDAGGSDARPEGG